MTLSRKDFIRGMLLGSAGVAVTSQLGLMTFSFSGTNSIKAIVIDYSKCTGCRTCEAVCSASNHPVSIAGEALPGAGNPDYSNIKVWHFNPPLDIPVTCFICADAPCIAACPVKPDAVTGRKALYRDEVFQTIQNDLNRCIGCQSCADACREERGGVIFPDDLGQPQRMCTLCQGNPQCVKYCPYEALSFLEITPDMPLRRMSPEKINQLLTEAYYQ